MQLQAKEIQQLKTLTNFLKTSFSGSSVAGFQVDDGVKVLEKILSEQERK